MLQSYCSREANSRLSGDGDSDDMRHRIGLVAGALFEQLGGMEPDVSVRIEPENPAKYSFDHVLSLLCPITRWIWPGRACSISSKTRSRPLG